MSQSIVAMVLLDSIVNSSQHNVLSSVYVILTIDSTSTSSYIQYIDTKSGPVQP